ncbi:MAG TPA: flagella basal body P-ring formation protein FlgA [Terriglobia bacterium]|nr:flagella basal body P-ring formation protein FlgA [Terriglobia bacterium]
MRLSSRANQGTDIAGLFLLCVSSLPLRRRAGQGAKSPERFVLPSCFLLLAPCFLLPSATKAASIQPRVHIPAVTQVEGGTLKLSDLLPPDAPAELGEMCTRIILGDSPLPASQRVISKGRIEERLREFPSLLERLEFPEQLVITCKQRRLSPAEIRTAIETFLAGEGAAGGVASTCFSKSATGMSSDLPRGAENGEPVCASDDLDLQAPVFVTRSDPGLKVKRLEADRVRGKIRFLLWNSQEPSVLPFYVTVGNLSEWTAWAFHHNQQTRGGLASADSRGATRKNGGDLAGSPELFSGSSAPVAAQKGEPTREATLPPVVLVAAGKPAKLVVETATLRLTVLVTPLESGVKGQLIRVRNLDTQRVLKAEVVGEGLLQAKLGGE